MNLIKKWLCKHLVKSALSCPFTGMTYIDCATCGRRLSVEPSHAKLEA